MSGERKKPGRAPNKADRDLFRRVMTDVRPLGDEGEPGPEPGSEPGPKAGRPKGSRPSVRGRARQACRNWRSAPPRVSMRAR